MIVYRIADIDLSLDYPSFDVFEALTPSAYRDFSVPSPPRAGMRITLRPGSTAEGQLAGRPIFQNGDCWSLFRDGDDYTLVVEPSNAAGSLSVTRFNPARGEAVVVYNHSVAALCRAAGRPVRNAFEYPVDRMLFMYLLASRSGFLCHAVGAQIGSCGMAFPGLSGAGKSTLAGLIARHPDSAVFSDERIAIRLVDGRFSLFGTPWLGEAGVALPGGSELQRLVFLEQAPDDRIERLSLCESLSRLLSLISVPWYNRDVVPRVLHLAERLVTSVPGYKLSFRPTPAVIDLLDSFCRTSEQLT